jgi:hypothetical protein
LKSQDKGAKMGENVVVGRMEKYGRSADFVWPFTCQKPRRAVKCHVKQFARCSVRVKSQCRQNGNKPGGGRKYI